VAEEFYTHRFDNGLMLLAQRMSQVASAAFTFALPMGTSMDVQPGSASVAAEWLLRGAGDRDTRQLNDELDGLGCQHDEHPNVAHLTLSSAQLGKVLPQTLAIYADIVRRPRMEDRAFEPCRDLVNQSLDGLEDEPMRKCNIMIREMFYPYPLGRNPLGDKASLAALTPDALRKHTQAHLSPRGAILAVAGQFEWDTLRGDVERLFGSWQGREPQPVTTRPPARGMHYEPKTTAQAQITLAYDAAPIQDKRYYAARISEMVLSGGMSARLFTEVREKRGLVYAVAARYHNLKGHAGIFVYAGTTPEKAQETLEVTAGELRNLGKDIRPEEIARSKTQVKSALIMQGESTSSRSDALAGDWYHLGRLRGLAEMSSAIDAVTMEQVEAYIREFPAKDLTAMTIGPAPLNMEVLR